MNTITNGPPGSVLIVTLLQPPGSGHLDFTLASGAYLELNVTAITRADDSGVRFIIDGCLASSEIDVSLFYDTTTHEGAVLPRNNDSLVILEVLHLQAIRQSSLGSITN